MLRPLFSTLELNEALTTLLSFGAAFAIITFLHVVIGEMTPKTMAIQNAEKISLIIARPIFWFSKLMGPAIRLMHGTSKGLLGIAGINTESNEQAHSEEDLKII